MELSRIQTSTVKSSSPSLSRSSRRETSMVQTLPCLSKCSAPWLELRQSLSTRLGGGEVFAALLGALPVQ
eukprot:4134023-Amphidinium_carterae.2